MADFLMQSRDNPMKALGLAASIITVMVLVTVMISTIIYFSQHKVQQDHAGAPHHTQETQRAAPLDLQASVWTERPELWEVLH